jgi:hypothetical protein
MRLVLPNEYKLSIVECFLAQWFGYYIYAFQFCDRRSIPVIFNCLIIILPQSRVKGVLPVLHESTCLSLPVVRLNH